MITYVTGPLNSGKTTAALSLLRGEHAAGGFFQHKLLQSADGLTTGYDLIRIRDNQRISLARRSDDLPPGWDAGPQLGRYSFSSSGIEAAIRCIREDAADARSPIVVDEVGRLELDRAGLFPVLEEIRERPLILVVRDIYLKAVQELIKSPEACRIIHCAGRGFVTTPGCCASGKNESQRSST